MQKGRNPITECNSINFQWLQAFCLRSLLDHFPLSVLSLLYLFPLFWHNLCELSAARKAISQNNFYSRQNEKPVALHSIHWARLNPLSVRERRRMSLQLPCLTIIRR